MVLERSSKLSRVPGRMRSALLSPNLPRHKVSLASHLGAEQGAGTPRPTGSIGGESLDPAQLGAVVTRGVLARVDMAPTTTTPTPSELHQRRASKVTRHAPAATTTASGAAGSGPGGLCPHRDGPVAYRDLGG